MMIATFDERCNRIGIVLGARVNSDGTPSRLLRLRVEAGAALLADGRVDLLVLTGGGRPLSEAQVMAEYARGLGVPAGRMILEPSALNTRSNAYRSISLLPSETAEVVVITNGFHLPRALMAFRRALRHRPVRVSGYAVATPRSGPSVWWAALREIPAYLADAVRGGSTR